ncbi:hypothetical protein [Butyrivibrio sp. NC3005]|uniref:hypothetical protein n=1 Tax=Butyrivibrio sp. NC3005 TaxID=1280685 RepID=UPI0004225CCB|nr:hypothetical protein [Butyrivibrio sp. NC3005]
MIKELPFVEPEIITFVYEAYPLGIMKANGIDYKKWLYSNYIQINCHDDIVKEKEVFNVFYGEVGINAPYLNVQKYSLDFLKRADMDLIQFFKKCIELDCYVYLKMDEFYIPQRDEYRKETFIHDEMITGYDESGFGVLGYDDKGKISKMILGFDEFLLAVSSNDSVYQKRMWADDVFVITPIKNSYELNINLIKRSLFD